MRDGASDAGRLREILLVAAATVAGLLPFVTKAFHVDDHRYVELARQIQKDPLDPYGITINLAGSEQALVYVANSPPLGPLYMIAASPFSGWGEIGLHLAFLLPALGVTLGTWWLGRRLCPDPLLAALVCLACPVFLVSATTIMPSVLMLALFCLSVACWMRAFEDGSHAWWLAAGVLAAGSALAKYFGIALVPLLFAYALYRERRLGVWAAYLLIPTGALVGFAVFISHVYGVDPLFSAAGYAVTARPEAASAFERPLVAFVFAGGALAPVLLFVAGGFTRRMGAAAIALGGIVLVACLLAGPIAEAVRLPDGDLDLGFLAHVVLFGGAGATILVLTVADLSRRLDADALLLALWIAGTFVFAAEVNYTTNGRVLLPLAPPVAILIARQLGTRGTTSLARYAPLVPAAALALLTAWGDVALAEASRSAARQLTARYAAAPGTLWFEGYWGFQHYMREGGARSVDVRRSILRPGDHLVTPANALPKLSVGPRAATEIETLDIPLPFVTTMTQDTGTGFHAIQWGPLPYRFHAPHTDDYRVRRIEEFVLFETDPETIEQRSAELEGAIRMMTTLDDMAARDWPPLEELGIAADPETAGRWSTCRPAFAALADAADRRCAWCATAAECGTCIETEAARAEADPVCATLLATAAYRSGLR